MTKSKEKISSSSIISKFVFQFEKRNHSKKFALTTKIDSHGKLFSRNERMKVYKIFLLWKHQTVKVSSLCHTSVSIRKKKGKCPIMGGMEGMNLPVPKEIN